MAVVSGTARLWAPYASRGFTPDGGVSWLLPRRIREVRVLRMLLIGEPVDGATAADWGMVDRCVPDDLLDHESERVVLTLAGSATVAVGLTKWLLHANRDASLDTQLRDEAFTGGGLHFVADADIVIAAEGAVFLDPHVSLGQASAFELITLARRGAVEPVLRVGLTGRQERLDATRACQPGIVSEVVPADAAAAGRQLAEKIARNPPDVLRLVKRQLWRH